MREHRPVGCLLAPGLVKLVPGDARTRPRPHTAVGKGSFLQFCAERLSAGTATDFFSDEASGPRLRTLREHAPPRRLLASSAASSPPLRHPFATHSTHHPASSCLPHLRTLVVGRRIGTGTNSRRGRTTASHSVARPLPTRRSGRSCGWETSCRSSPRSPATVRRPALTPQRGLIAPLPLSLSQPLAASPLSRSLSLPHPPSALRGPQPPQPPPAHYPSLSRPWHLSAFQASARSRRACSTWADQRE